MGTWPRVGELPTRAETGDVVRVTVDATIAPQLNVSGRNRLGLPQRKRIAPCLKLAQPIVPAHYLGKLV